MSQEEDAVLIADYYYYKVPEEVYAALKQAFEQGLEPALTLAKYINEIPPEILQAQNRILEGYSL